MMSRLKIKQSKINLEKELATLTQLEKDKKQLLKSIEGNRNEIERFFSVTKDNLYDKRFVSGYSDRC